MSEQKQTLLVVDDEANVLKSVKRLLFETDYRVLTAGSGQEALELFKKEPTIQLVISDYRMPEMNGVELLRQLKKLYPTTVRMILSGYADVMAIVEAINDGQVYKFIAKPWNDQDLLTTIMRAFEQYSLAEENVQLTGQLREQNKKLEEAAAELEDKVQKRTRDLALKNRALAMTHRILDLLPAGVVGIDPDGTVVYSNDIALRLLGAENLCLQSSVESAFEPEILKSIMETITSQKNFYGTLRRECTVDLIARPLPQKAGVICLLIALDSDCRKTGPGANERKREGVADG
jgi:two-component system NtrC family sensor kinase